MVHQSGLLVLEPGEQRAQGFGRVEPHPHRQGVDEKAHHRLDARDLRRAPRDGAPEDYVVPPGELPEHDGPGRLDNRVDGESVLGRPAGERSGRLRRQLEPRVAGGDRLPGRGGRGGKQGRLIHPVDDLPPGRGGGGVVLAGEPAEVLAVGGDRAEPGSVAVTAVQLEEFADEDGSRPAVEEDVVVGEEEPVPLAAQVEEGEAQQRRAARVKTAGPVGGEQPGQLRLLAGGGQRAQVGVGPVHLHLARDYLHRVAVLAVAEARAKVGVSAERGSAGRPQRLGVQGALDLEDELHGVEVRALLVVLRVEQQPLLQR